MFQKKVMKDTDTSTYIHSTLDKLVVCSDLYVVGSSYGLGTIVKIG
jgi:hypothetical protein